MGSRCYVARYRLERRSGLDSWSLERQALKRRSSGYGGYAQAAWVNCEGQLRTGSDCGGDRQT